MAAKDGVRPDPSGWKTPDGYVPLSNAEAIEMALTVQAHIQACYDSEKAMTEQIDGCSTMEELEALSIAV